MSVSLFGADDQSIHLSSQVSIKTEPEKTLGMVSFLEALPLVSSTNLWCDCLLYPGRPGLSANYEKLSLGEASLKFLIICRTTIAWLVKR